MVKYKRSCSKAQLAALARGRAIRARNIQLGGAGRLSRSPTSTWRKGSSGYSSDSVSRSPKAKYSPRQPFKMPSGFQMGPSILETKMDMDALSAALPEVSPCAARRKKKSKSKCSNCGALLAILAAAGIGATGKFGVPNNSLKRGIRCIEGIPPRRLENIHNEDAQELCGVKAWPVESCINQYTPGNVIWYPNKGEKCAILKHGEKQVKAIGNRNSMNRHNKVATKRKKSGKNKRKKGRK